MRGVSAISAIRSKTPARRETGAPAPTVRLSQPDSAPIDAPSSSPASMSPSASWCSVPSVRRRANRAESPDSSGRSPAAPPPKSIWIDAIGRDGIGSRITRIPARVTCSTARGKRQSRGAPGPGRTAALLMTSPPARTRARSDSLWRRVSPRSAPGPPSPQEQGRGRD